MNRRGAKIVISQRPQRCAPLEIDKAAYKWRRLVENFLSKVKNCKRIAMRSDKTGRSRKAMIYAAAAVIHAR